MEKETAATSKFIDPEHILGGLAIAENSLAADFGCGSGYFTIPMAKKLKDGQLYALDVLPAALESVASKAKIAGLKNIITKRVNLEKENGSKFEKDTFDWIILKDMLFQNKSKDIVLKEVYRVLKPGGKVLIIEWADKETSIGPLKDLKINRDNLEQLVRNEKFKIDSEIEAGDFHYGFVASK